MILITSCATCGCPVAVPVESEYEATSIKRRLICAACVPAILANRPLQRCKQPGGVFEPLRKQSGTGPSQQAAIGGLLKSLGPSWTVFPQAVAEVPSRSTHNQKADQHP
jgi:hypothetical protein